MFNTGEHVEKKVFKSIRFYQSISNLDEKTLDRMGKPNKGSWKRFWPH